MPLSTEALRPYLQAFDFPSLLVEGLGWNHYRAAPLNVSVDDHDYSLRPVAEKKGFAVFECAPAPSGEIPTYPRRRRIESQVAKRTFEHIIVFVNERRTAQIWQWVRRESDSRSLACREQAVYRGQSGLPLLQRLQQLSFSLDEESSLTISDVLFRVRRALDVEKVTNRFYVRFRKELSKFADFIDGILVQENRDWYASLMLNRMMFIYFIQKQGFLDDDLDYLRTRLRIVQARGNTHDFHRFYRIFLRRLFHKGLGQPEAQRAPEIFALLGKVPFLNGGLFDVHDLERDNPGISIPDEAFERLFDFFDRYRWHLDERPDREDNEINPDVLGYIFEKYINQKQMGAYYTKEDVTGYITRNTVVARVLDIVAKERPAVLGSGGSAWRLVQEDPGRYIYPALGHGICWNVNDRGNPEPLDAPLPLPASIAAGVNQVAVRKNWNDPAPDSFALPSETWRDVVGRRQRYGEVHSKAAHGTVQGTDDVIALNLDIERFGKDAISQAEDPETLRSFWKALSEVSILDPACGSGAFLFASLNALEPLYTACLEGMRGFLGDLERSGLPGTACHRHFQAVVCETEKHPSERYFILKSIVLRNLYGVDIMDEGVEICKLRLFLKLVAQLATYDQIEPLPDIDFNIRAGNSLVGFTDLDAVLESLTVTPDGQRRAPFGEELEILGRIRDQAELAGQAFDRFREKQRGIGGAVTAKDKAELRGDLRTLDDQLDRLLATDGGIAETDTAAFTTWRDCHKPFHWFVEFYPVLAGGGFDAVVGNPPYVQYRDGSFAYRVPVKHYRTSTCGDLYAFCAERSMKQLKAGGRIGLILPISAFGVDKFGPLQTLALSSLDAAWLSFYANRPGQLFEGAQNRLTILLGRGSHGGAGGVHTSQYLRWRREERDGLFTERIAYTKRETYNRVFPAALEKLGSQLEVQAFARLVRPHTTRLGAALASGSSFRVFYTRGFSYFLAFLDFVPKVVHTATGVRREPSELKSLTLGSRESATATIAALSSSTFFWYWNVVSDCRNLNRRDLLAFPFNPEKLEPRLKKGLVELGETYLQRLRATSWTMRKGELSIEAFELVKCKDVLDQIDTMLAQYYGFEAKELDFIKNYDFKYRSGK